MRTRAEINQSPAFPEVKMLEVLLDIRDILNKREVKKLGRPPKQKKRREDL